MNLKDPPPFKVPTSDKPPVRDKAPKRPTSSAKPRSGNTAVSLKQVEESLNQMFSMLGMVAFTAGKTMTATVFIGDLDSDDPSSSEQMVAAWVQLAGKKPRVRKVLESLVVGGDYALVTSTTLAVLLPVALDFGLIPEGLLPKAIFGITDDDPKD